MKTPVTYGQMGGRTFLEILDAVKRFESALRRVAESDHHPRWGCTPSDCGCHVAIALAALEGR